MGIETARASFVRTKGNIFFMANYLDEFQGIPRGESFSCDADKTVRLPNVPCRFAKLANWNQTTDADTNFTHLVNVDTILPEGLNADLYWGFVGEQGGDLQFQLFAGRDTEIFPIDNLSRIIFRARPAQAGRLYVAWWT
jgi:hypothetical protein